MNQNTLMQGLIVLGALLFIAPTSNAATWTVNNSGDRITGSAANCAIGNAGTCMFRDAIVAVADGGSIVFNLSDGNTTVQLHYGQLKLSGASEMVLIDGLNSGNSNRVSIRGNNSFRILENEYSNIEISHIIMENGNALAGC